MLSIISVRSAYFNSQPHKEADCGKGGLYAIRANFNSQPHKEADAEKEQRFYCSKISTHSLTRRLTAISDKNIFIQN